MKIHKLAAFAALLSATCLFSQAAAAQSQVVRVNCESHQSLPELCMLGDQILNANIAQKISRATCNNNVGFGGQTLVIQNGCRANFDVTIAGNRAINQMTCQSFDYRLAECTLPVTNVRAIWAANKLSSAPCRTGQDFRIVNGNVLQVLNGCRATFNYTTD